MTLLILKCSESESEGVHDLQDLSPFLSLSVNEVGTTSGQMKVVRKHLWEEEATKWWWRGGTSLSPSQALSYFSVVSYPTRWSFSLILGPLHWSSIFLTSKGKRNIVQLCTNFSASSTKFFPLRTAMTLILMAFKMSLRYMKPLSVHHALNLRISIGLPNKISFGVR